MIRTIYISLFSLIILTAAHGTAQAQKKYKACGIKCTATRITDPGELFSTYSFYDTDLAELKQSGISDHFISDIQSNSTEETWPQAMQTLDGRLENAATIKAYKVFRVAGFGDSRVLLVVSAKHNKKQPKGFAPSRDFYIVIDEKGLEN